MPRSFKLKFFLLVTVSIVFFAIVTRISVRYTSTKPLHELLYANFASYLELSLDEKSFETLNAQGVAWDSQSTLALQPIEQKINAFYSDLKPHEAQVWVGDKGNELQQTMLAEAKWRDLKNTVRTYPVQLAEIGGAEGAWVLFRATQATQANLGNQSIYVAIPAHVYQQKFNDIMLARESIVNSLWPLLLVCIFLCTWFLTFWVVRSLQNLQNTFQKIDLKGKVNTLSEKQFDVEFASFIDYFNSLIQRLQLNYEQASRFSSDAAHELRTPLTVIRGNLRRLLNRAADNSVEQIQLSMLSDEVERLISITNKLVLLSQADGDNFKLDLKELHLFDLIAVIGEDIQSLVPHVQFEYAVNPEIKVLADPNLFQQFLNNLVSNAIKYTSPQGQIKFNAKVFGDIVEFSLANTTFLSLEGIDDRIFQRFYRHLGEPHAGIQRPKGDGLGLSLCQEIAKAHGATLHLHKGPGQWVTFKGTWQRA
jgi:signal transduction histidine kinase